ncbi:uncharacterized protein LOC122276903 [Carya illinoinensis]|uniref:uncharacterized protein LOC122276903 n=1 Tax=Carya illinoinensis TaxID=32201 RepID=UPI001C718DAD|nr:uncharacterized protein LOC122276903 [Carya illinoinensis]
MLTSLVGEEKFEEIVRGLGQHKEGSDRLIWTSSVSGGSSSKSALDLIRVKAPKVHGAEWMWNAALPKKYSITMWKAMKGCLRVGDMISKIGIPMVSKCECCEEGKLEDLDHVLAIGKTPKALWNKVSTQVGMPFDPEKKWKEKIHLWFRRAGKSSQKGLLIGLIPSILTWSLWLWQCKARMEAIKASIESLWQSVKAAITWCGIHLKAGNKSKPGDREMLKALCIPSKDPKGRRVQLVTWRKPAMGWCKLNVDGSCRGNPG